MWINQPSTAQPFHRLHGVRVLAEENTRYPETLVYFLDGPVTSQGVPRLALSEGWPASSRITPPVTGETLIYQRLPEAPSRCFAPDDRSFGPDDRM